jgi:hypothetical protein
MAGNHQTSKTSERVSARPELLRTVDGQGFRAVPFDTSEDADETRNQSTS